MKESKLNVKTIAIILVALSVAINVFGYFTMAETTNVGGIFSRTGEPIEVPTVLILVLFLFFTAFMCGKMAFNKRDDADTSWLIVNCCIVVFNAVVVFFVK